VPERHYAQCSRKCCASAQSPRSSRRAHLTSRPRGREPKGAIVKLNVKLKNPAQEWLAEESATKQAAVREKAAPAVG
jgi:hypothetical protein